jgi:hypothetical protein
VRFSRGMTQRHRSVGSGVPIELSAGGVLNDLLRRSSAAVTVSSTMFLDCLQQGIPVIGLDCYPVAWATGARRRRSALVHPIVGGGRRSRRRCDTCGSGALLPTPRIACSGGAGAVKSLRILVGYQVHDRYSLAQHPIVREVGARLDPQRFHCTLLRSRVRSRAGSSARGPAQHHVDPPTAASPDGRASSASRTRRRPMLVSGAGTLLVPIPHRPAAEQRGRHEHRGASLGRCLLVSAPDGPPLRGSADHPQSPAHGRDRGGSK